jgi:hypothetical protein
VACVGLPCLGSLACPPAAAAEKFTLKESSAEGQIELLETRVSVSGTAQFAIEKTKSVSHPISAEATLKYRERRLPGAGRDAEALRGLRRYEDLQSEIRVAEHVTTTRLREDRRLIVANGRREGIFFYSPTGPLTAAELELLRAPADGLGLAGLLPATPVAVGETWTPPSWVAQMLTDTEAASKAELSCTLATVEDDTAKVTLDGLVEGASSGSSCNVQLKGFFLFDLKSGRMTRAELDQTEKRSIGPVSPGMKITAKAIVARTVTNDAAGLGDAEAAAVPLEPPAALTLLRFRAPWNVELEHDRSWRVFQQSPQVAVLRLLDKGTFVAQCNLAPVRAAAPGEHVTEKQFEDDIRDSLGARLKSIEQRETVPTDDGRFVFRVVAAGRSNDVPVTWIYYLCAAPDGEQVSFVFAVETSLRPKLEPRELAMVKSVKFLKPRPPQKAVAP